MSLYSLHSHTRVTQRYSQRWVVSPFCQQQQPKHCRVTLQSTVTLRYSQRWIVSPFCQQQQPKRRHVTLQSTQSHYATASGGSCLHSASNSSQNVAMSLYSLHSHTRVTLRYSQRWVVSPFCQQQQPKHCRVTLQSTVTLRYSQRWIVSPFCQQQQPKRCYVTLQSTQSHYSNTTLQPAVDRVSILPATAAKTLPCHFTVYSHTTLQPAVGRVSILPATAAKTLPCHLTVYSHTTLQPAVDRVSILPATAAKTLPCHFTVYTVTLGQHYATASGGSCLHSASNSSQNVAMSLYSLHSHTTLQPAVDRVSILPATAAKTLPCHFTVYTVTLRYSQRWIVSPFCQQQQPKHCLVTLQSTQSHYGNTTLQPAVDRVSILPATAAKALLCHFTVYTVTLRYSQRWIVSPFCQQQQPKHCRVTLQSTVTLRYSQRWVVSPFCQQQQPKRCHVTLQSTQSH